LWQHLFWFFGHPEVYIIFLPAAGAMSTIIPAIAQTPLVGYRLVVLAMLATGFISFGVWAHHMFTTGMPTMSTKLFLGGVHGGQRAGGRPGLRLDRDDRVGKHALQHARAVRPRHARCLRHGRADRGHGRHGPFDWQAHDSYFIVAHLHYVLIGGMVFRCSRRSTTGCPSLSARPLSERMGKWVFWLMFIGMHITFLPMHLTGLMGMPRRVYTYLPGRGWEIAQSDLDRRRLSHGVAVLIWVIDMVRNFRPFGPRNAGGVYDGPGLEWLPSGLYSTRSIPVVTSLYPLVGADRPWRATSRPGAISCRARPRAGARRSSPRP
jgi:cytochrome c oxidase subunit I+III